MEAQQKKILIIFSIILVIISGGLGIYYQILTTRIWHVTNESSFIELNRDDGISIDFSGDTAFVAMTLGGVKVYDFSDPQNPTYIRSVPSGPVFISDQALEGDLLYILNYTNLIIFNVTNLENITKVGDYYLPEAKDNLLCSIVVENGIAYMADRYRLIILNTTDPYNIVTLSSTYVRYFEERELDYENGLVYFTNYVMGLNIYDVEDPSAPELLVEIKPYSARSTLVQAKKVNVLDGIIYITDQSLGLIVLDATDIDNIHRIFEYGLSFPSMVYQDETKMYLADPRQGLKTIGTSTLPEGELFDIFNLRSGISDIYLRGDSLVILGEDGISIVKVERGIGRNPDKVADVKAILPGIYEITGGAFFVIFVLNKLKQANI